jgi:hypothetical protein
VSEWRPGDQCTVNDRGDLFMDWGARMFIGKPCVIVKRCKSGLIQIALEINPRYVYSVPQRNVDALPQ